MNLSPFHNLSRNDAKIGKWHTVTFTHSGDGFARTGRLFFTPDRTKKTEKPF
jgi:hypothetical protein